MYYYLYDIEGFYGGMTETEPEHNLWTNTAPSFTNLKEKWNGSAWIEGATPEEIAATKKPIFLKDIYSISERLYHSAKERALGKVGQNLSKEQLAQLEKQYEVKKEVAERIVFELPIENQIIYDLIDFEQENDFSGSKLLATINFLNSTYNANIPTENVSRIKLYAYLILAKYAQGKKDDSDFTNLIEYFRSKMITWLDNNDFSKIDSGKAIVSSITPSHTIEDIKTNLKNQFDAL